MTRAGTAAYPRALLPMPPSGSPHRRHEGKMDCTKDMAGSCERMQGGEMNAGCGIDLAPIDWSGLNARSPGLAGTPQPMWTLG